MQNEVGERLTLICTTCCTGGGSWCDVEGAKSKGVSWSSEIRAEGISRLTDALRLGKDNESGCRVVCLNVIVRYGGARARDIELRGSFE